MKVIGENNKEEQKLLEEKRNKMYELIKLNNISIKENVYLLINDWCAEHIKTLHKEYPHTEWLAFCKVEPQGNGVFLMTDMIFPWQKGVSADVETTEEWMKWLSEELLRRWEDWKLWNCVLHSHHTMGCFWSGTDDNARKSLNDWRQLAWAVVTAYDKEGNINYKGCLNFYKPYNIEIDVNVMNNADMTIVDKYNDYLQEIAESEASFYDFLTEENKEYIDSITETPSYNNISEYLWLDITDDLKKNYDEIKDKIGNPELLDYLKSLSDLSHRLAVEEVNNNGAYSDLLAEYGAFCDWSDNLLTQLEENRKTKTETAVQWTLLSETAYPTNRYFDDYDCYFTAPDFDEYYVRSTFWIPQTVPMKVWQNDEWLAWSFQQWQYVYVEERAEEYWS